MLLHSITSYYCSSYYTWTLFVILWVYISFPGVIVANGFKNMLTFRNFKATVARPLPIKLSRCGPKTHITNDTVVLDAAYPYWPINLFCAALYKRSLNNERESYSVKTMLYNINSYAGSYWGQLGIMYNALNHYTFEYVYIRLAVFHFYHFGLFVQHFFSITCKEKLILLRFLLCFKTYPNAENIN